MKIRDLKEIDASKMIEWMHDQSLVEKLQTKFQEKTIDDCKLFIQNSKGKDYIHLAIADDNDNYMGTVSLKHITVDTAEFAITICRDAMGKGYSSWAMKEAIRIAFEEYGVKKVYWCVADDNLRALRFYDKNAYPRVRLNDVASTEGYTEEQKNKYVWYQVEK